MRGLIYCSTQAFVIFGAYGNAYGKLTGGLRDATSALGEHLWSIWDLLATSWILLGPLGCLLNHLGCLLGASWGLLGTSRVLLGTTWLPCALGDPPGTGQGAYRRLTGSLWEAYGNLPGGLVRELSSPLEPSWVLLGASWGILGASWAPFGASWLPLGPSWVPLGSSWESLGCLLGIH